MMSKVVVLSFIFLVVVIPNVNGQGLIQNNIEPIPRHFGRLNRVFEEYDDLPTVGNADSFFTIGQQWPRRYLINKAKNEGLYKKRTFDEIDRAAFGGLKKRPFHKIDMAAFNGFQKRE
ncbi:orcokinin peptides type A-like [Limulus polyphemus]|uniref:Orcokinin peptides type A-like n=1 Tax=Limulus polyphemus TaxID=6850 RepID=A0ABM1S7T0_LIMPO|nr:orcokinin peptides type A-like [Limulus polyphemus]